MNAYVAVFLVVIAVVGPGLVGEADAQPWPALDDAVEVEAATTNDVAVIVAVEDYLLLPDVVGAVANANEWETFFRRDLQLEDVHVLFNQDATRESMLKFARTAAADVGPAGTIWWIFIGHGAPSISGEDGLMVGMDAQQSVESLESRGLPQRELLAVLEGAPGRTVMIVDACFSGRAADGTALAAGVQPVVAIDATVGMRASSVVLSAAKATQVAGQLPGAPRPAFSYLMLAALRGWADEGDGEVTAGEALFFAQRQLRGVKGRTQTPQAVGNLQAVLSRGVVERQPRHVEPGEGVADTERCPEGQVREEGGCVPAPDSRPDSAPTTDPVRGKAELTLEYLQRRLVFEGATARQGNRVLPGPAFYHALGQPDLAEKWRSHNPYLWVPGLVATAGGLFLFVYGIAQSQSESITEGAQTGWFIGGSLGGFFTMAGGISLVTFGFIFDYHPMSLAQRKSAAEEFNAKLREERGLGPEVDWQNQPVRSRGGLNIFGATQVPAGRGIGVKFTF